MPIQFTKNLKYLTSTVAIVFVLFFISQVLIAYAPKDKQQITEGVPADYKVFNVQLPKIPILAGERVPVHLFDVKETLDREFHINTYWQSNTILMMKRANRYFPIVEPILKEHGIPDDFKYLMVIESGMLNVKSRAGAAGFWQIMKTTGREYGLEITREIDERYHLKKSTVVACKYFKDAYRKFQNWTLVAASYNRGRAGLRRGLKHQQVSDYWELFLNKETARYVSRIIALKYIMQEPEKYGFYITPEDKYPPLPTYEIKVEKPIADWAIWAKKHNASYKLLRHLNPWILDKKLTRNNKTYNVTLLKKGYRTPQTVDDDLLKKF